MRAKSVTTEIQLQVLLDSIKKIDGDFAGIGLIFCKNEAFIPHIPLYPHASMCNKQDVLSVIIERARLSNPLHDGFHILSPDWILKKANVYVAPPILPDFVHYSEDCGSRFLTALLSSQIQGVTKCVTITVPYECYIFENGKAKHFPF